MRYVLGLLILVGIAAVVGGTVWRSQTHDNTAAASDAADLAIPATIETALPVRRDFIDRLPWFGKVESTHLVTIVPLSAGMITTVPVADGARVRKHDVLFTLGGPRVTRALRTLEQHITFLDQQVASATRVVQVKREAAAEKMAKKEDLLAVEEHLAQLNGQRSAAKQQLAALQDTLVIRSPIDGLFTQRQVYVGQEVETGTTLATVVGAHLRIVARSYPPAGASLSAKTVVIQNGLEHKITGVVKRVLAQRTAEGATVTWIESAAIDAHMHVGATVSGSILLDLHKSVLAVPRTAVVRDADEAAFVFVKSPHGYRKTAVKPGLVDGSWREILSGISADDRIVVRGAYGILYQDFARAYKVED